MMSPSHCYLILLSPVHHLQHHFHYASLFLPSTPDSKLTFSINHSHSSLLHLFGLIARILRPFPDLISALVFYFGLSLFSLLV